MNKLAYILAASHSGSTLLSMLLGAHPEAATCGELKAGRFGDVENYRCSCGALILKCPFWAAVCDGMRRRGHDYGIANANTNVQEITSHFIRRCLQPRGRTRHCLQRHLCLFLHRHLPPRLLRRQCGGGDCLPPHAAWRAHPGGLRSGFSAESSSCQSLSDAAGELHMGRGVPGAL